MAINLQKGQKVDIGYSNLSIGLGWTPNEGTGFDFDLDASAFMINEKRKIPTEEHFIFYNNYCANGHGRNNPCTDCGSGKYGVIHTGDDPTGGNSVDGDDESILIDLSKVSSDITEILFVVTIDEAIFRKQNFGQVRDSYIRIVDNSSGIESHRFQLDEDYSSETAIEFGRLYKREGKWKFDPTGVAYKEDLAFFLSKYFSGQIIK